MIPNTKRLCDPFYGSISERDLFNDPKKVSVLSEAVRYLEPGETLFEPGESSDRIYILQNGEAGIYVQQGSPNSTFSHPIEPGRLYGLIEAVSGGPMWYSIKARTRCSFSVIYRETLLAALAEEPALCFRLARILSQMDREIMSVSAG